ncbi:flagellar hook-length control protein FliK [Labrenzia sp. R4_1]|uniref:flagellar hook-length control protein FliK n=1 Tax=Labrenzia sp. R4_1 TaxID=2821106 RepID=UPI001ADD2D59|nr:flagellar hook-length control protein FliK [Labrenzia sp. R4_1]MBO9425631.1 flagellar hook-length control protein FliK [Labrenzia sp. R4_1]
MTAASSSANRGGASVAGPMGKVESGFRQFSDDLQETLQALAPDSVAQEGGAVSGGQSAPNLDALKADAAELAGDAVASAEAAAGDEALEAGAVLAEDPGAAVPGSLGEIWQAAAGEAPVFNAAGPVPAAEDGGLVEEAGLPLVRPAADGDAAAAGSNGGDVQGEAVAAKAGAASKPGFASALGSAGLGAAGATSPAGVSEAAPASSSRDVSDLPLPVNRQPTIAPQVETAAGDVAGQEGKAAATVAEAADPAKPLSTSSAVEGGLSRTSDAPIIEPKQRRWQVSLPPELRSQSVMVQTAPQNVPVAQAEASGEVLDPLQQAARAQAAVQAAGAKEPVAKSLRTPAQGSAQINAQPGISSAANNQPVAAPQIAEVSATQDEASVRQPAAPEVARPAPVTPSMPQVQPAPAASAQPPVTPVAVSNRPTTPTVPQPAIAEPGGADLGVDDLAVDVDAEPVRLERRPAGEVLFAGAQAPSVNSAAPQMQGLSSGQPQMVAMQSSGGAGQQSAIPAAALSNEIIADEILPASAFEADLGADLDFTATVRGGEMQGAARTEALQTPNQAQSSQLASQVAVEMARNLKNAQTRFQMRFDPPELGRVDVNMKVAADGSVQAHLIVERPETLDMFLRDQRGLERALEAAGLNANSNDLQFSLKQGPGQQFASQDEQGQQNGQSGTANTDADGGGDASADEAMDGQLLRMTLAEQRGGLDVRI